MIVRCKSCVSAFAVDDGKVANRKFAFTCPKCGIENIFDNRGPAVAVKTAEFDDFHDEDIFADASEQKIPAAEKTEERIPDDIFAEEHAPEKTIEDEFASFDDEFIDEPSPKKPGKKLNLDIEEAPAEMPESDFSFSDDDIMFDEPPAPSGKEKTKAAPAADEEIFIDDFKTDTAAGASSSVSEADLNEPDFTSIDLDSELAGIDLDSPTLEELHVKPGKSGKASAEKSDGLPEDFHITDDFEEKVQPEKSDRDKKLTDQSDIDALFAEAAPLDSPAADDINVDLDTLDIEFEEKPSDRGIKTGTGGSADTDEMLFFDEEPAVPGKEKDEITLDVDTIDLLQEPEQRKPLQNGKAESDEDITIDIDSLDLEIEEPEAKPDVKKTAEEDEFALDMDSLDIELEEPAAKPAGKKKSAEDEFALDMDSMDIEMEEPAAMPRAGKKPEDEELALDIESLDIELEKAPSTVAGDDVFFSEEEVAIDMDSLDFDGGAGVPEKRPVKGARTEKEIVDEDITIDIDSLDIDIEEPVHPSVKALPEKRQVQAEPDDSITLDIDSLDIDIEEPVFDEKISEAERFPEDDIEIDMESLDFDGIDEKPEPVRKRNVRDIVREQAGDTDEEDIRLNLDELDIDIDEINEKDLDFVKPAAKSHGPMKGIIEEAPEDEDESITIDLDTLDIEVAESSAVAESELSEEDEKLTLDDAGITFDELTFEEKPRKQRSIDLADDEEIKLTLDDIDPEMRLDQIGEVAPPDEPLLRESINELPEISIDEFDAVETASQRDMDGIEHEYNQDDEIIFPEDELELDIEPAAVSAVKASRYSDEIETESYSESTYPSRGNTSFSIDFSLRYSRFGAFLRLIQLYTISMLPHFVLIFIYTLLSGILGFINQIVILSTGRCVEDFSQITENTLRYYLYIQTCITGIVEDRPVFSGREKIDHQMQLNLTYPLKYSKLLAALRLSMIGIFLITLPHIIMMLFITCLVPLVYLVGIIAVIITARWPNPLFAFLTMYFRYMAKISAFMTGITDEYPPFRFD